MDLFSADHFSRALVIAPNIYGYFVDFMIVDKGERIAIEAHGQHFHSVLYVDAQGNCIDNFVEGHTLLKERYLRSRGIPIISIWSHHWNGMKPTEQSQYLQNEIEDLKNSLHDATGDVTAQ